MTLLEVTLEWRVATRVLKDVSGNLALKLKTILKKNMSTSMLSCLAELNSPPLRNLVLLP